MQHNVCDLFLDKDSERLAAVNCLFEYLLQASPPMCVDISTMLEQHVFPVPLGPYSVANLPYEP